MALFPKLVLNKSLAKTRIIIDKIINKYTKY